MPIKYLVLVVALASCVAQSKSAGEECLSDEIALLQSRLEVQKANEVHLDGAQSCPASSQEYYRLNDLCREGKAKMQSMCPTNHYDRACVNEAYAFNSRCTNKAYKCYQEIRKVCPNGTPEKYISDIPECEPEQVKFGCDYTARNNYLVLSGDCDKQYAERTSECPVTKIRGRCIGAAAALFNECTDAAQECESAMKKSESCESEGLPKCTQYIFRKPVSLQPGPPLELVSMSTYKIFSVSGCQWAGQYCNKPIARRGWDIKLSSDDYATPWRFQATGNANEFYLWNALGTCATRLCYPLSYKPGATCPESGWNDDFDGCVRTRYGRGYGKIPFTFTRINETDQFVIRTSATCPDGEVCNWQLSSNEESCGKKLPIVTLEQLSFDNIWRLEKVA